MAEGVTSSIVKLPRIAALRFSERLVRSAMEVPRNQGVLRHEVSLGFGELLPGLILVNLLLPWGLTRLSPIEALRARLRQVHLHVDLEPRPGRPGGTEEDRYPLVRLDLGVAEEVEDREADGEDAEARVDRASACSAPIPVGSV
jgi:hypothetical protein